MSSCRPSLPFVFALLAAAAAAAGPPPVAVSPGSTSGIAHVPGPCPTFSWSAVAGATGYELVVLPADEPLAGAPAELAPEASGSPPVLEVTIRGAAVAWTPSAEQCLAGGRRYAWSVRALTAEEVGPWAEAQLFEVGAGRAAELELLIERVLERLLAARGLSASEPRARPTARDAANAGGSGAEPGGMAANPGSAAVPASDKTAFYASTPDTTGAVTYGVHGVTHSAFTGSTGVVGEATDPVGSTRGVVGSVASSFGIGGLFENSGGGTILAGSDGGSIVFSVSGTGHVAAISLSGDGSALTGVSADTASTADNADKVDGKHAEDFLSSNSSDTYTGSQLTIATGKELNVDGTLRMDGPVIKSGTGVVANLNADLLDGLNASSFLRANTSTTFSSGILGLDGDTTLDVNGTLRMDGTVIKTGTGVVTNFNADLLDGLNASSFLRSNTSDAYTVGTLTVSGGATLDVDGTLRMDGSVVKTGTATVANFSADLLDGQHASAFASSIHDHEGETWTTGGNGLTVETSGTGVQTALEGVATDTGTGSATGVTGKVSSTGGVGVLGWSTHPTGGIGLKAFSNGNASPAAFFVNANGGPLFAANTSDSLVGWKFAVSNDGNVEAAGDLTIGGVVSGSGAEGAEISSSCGTFVAVALCPAGDVDGPACDTVAAGAYCEYDSSSGCTNLDVNLDNCGPSDYDWYFRSQ